ncbi:MAG: hypothetical protein L6366_05285 [Candidatus Omnitrophica bacterium]|nr:hypothetical protein [Candidatus Omnitrophota bacterium]
MKHIRGKKPNFEVYDEIFNEIGGNLETEYKEVYQNMGARRERNKKIESWLNDKRNSEKLRNLKEIFKRSFEKTLSWDKFKNKYGEDSSRERCCFYCEIKETQIEEMFNEGKINTKRIYSRGMKMEVERKNPLVGYINGNIELCCYWCNNAKSDEFTEKEFSTHMQKGIKAIWRERTS